MKDELKQLSLAMQHDANQAWETAHQIVQQIEQPLAYQIHAYLHRKEGNLDNARYWYQRAKVKEFEGDLAAEYQHILKIIKDREHQ